jgi:SPP1 family predicted phage head-tail adaptor
LWINVAELLTIITVTDDAGDPTEQQTFTRVFCNELSVGQTEFYQAMATGLKPEIKLELNRFEYNNEKKVKYNNIVYDVIRTYAKDVGIIEVTLGGGVNNATS